MFLYQDALTDLTGQQEELNIDGVGTCHAHKVPKMFLFLGAKFGGSEVFKSSSFFQRIFLVSPQKVFK